MVELIETVASETIEQLWAQVRDAVSDAQRDFPVCVLEPDFDSDGAGGYAAIFALTKPEGFSLTRAAREAEGLADRLRRVSGTSLIDLQGVPEEEVLFTLNPDRILMRDGLSRLRAPHKVPDLPHPYRGGYFHVPVRSSHPLSSGGSRAERMAFRPTTRPGTA